MAGGRAATPPRSSSGTFFARARAIPSLTSCNAAEALQIASERVKAKYGFPCSLALGQLVRIEAMATRFEGQDDARVACETFLDGGAR
jgi:uncharacterized repeat protein (TIGR04042 family)